MVATAAMFARTCDDLVKCDVFGGAELRNHSGCLVQDLC